MECLLEDGRHLHAAAILALYQHGVNRLNKEIIVAEMVLSDDQN